MEYIMAKRKRHRVVMDKFTNRGRKVIEIATGEVVHWAPTPKAAYAVARRMHGVMVAPSWSIRAA